MRSAYLTIDDSASARMDDLVSYLEGKGIPALFFCRGDRLEENPMAAVNAVKKGFILANHTYSHQRASEKDVQFTIDEIRQCDFLLNRIYKEAGVLKTRKHFRYPHVDRGAGAWIVDYDACDDETKKAVMNEITAGVNVGSMDRPDDAAFARKDALQQWLAEDGYTDPFKDVTHAWYRCDEISRARDSLFTFSNCDWMLNERQRGKWPFKTPADLKHKARNDRYLIEGGSVNIVLAHDQADIVDVTIELIDDMAESGLTFLEV